MEKLIELLNQYEKEVRKSEYYEWEKWIWWPFLLFRRDTYDEEWSHLYSDTSDTYVISKKYWFIQRLLNNQKIDQEKLDHSLDSCFHINNDVAWSCIKLTMYLAIQDNPIEFLVSILK